MGFAVCHISKGSAGNTSGLGSHIDRTKFVPNANPKESKDNFDVVQDANGELVITQDFQNKELLGERIKQRIAEGYAGKATIRKDAVTHLNIVLSGSHEDMIKLRSSGRLEEWAKANYRFMADRYGARNIINFTIHVDERTPHIHCVVVPLTPDGRLSAKKVMGDSRKMTELQTSYGKAMDCFGLERGIEGSTATHDSVKEFYARVNNTFKRANIDARMPEDFREPPQFDNIPTFGKSKWLESVNKAIRESFSNGSIQLVNQWRKNQQNDLNAIVNDVFKLTNANKNLRKENSQLKGVIKQLQKVKLLDGGMEM